MPDRTEKQKIGALGEDISVKYLKNKGFEVVERNYLRKCGEIDIIAQKGGVLHFIEVKSVSCEISSLGQGLVSCETDTYRPEENIHPAKLKRLARTIQVYLLDRSLDNEPVWQFDAIIVKLDIVTKRAKVQLMQDLVI